MQLIDITKEPCLSTRPIDIRSTSSSVVISSSSYYSFLFLDSIQYDIYYTRSNFAKKSQLYNKRW